MREQYNAVHGKSELQRWAVTRFAFCHHAMSSNANAWLLSLFLMGLRGITNGQAQMIGWKLSLTTDQDQLLHLVFLRFSTRLFSRGA